MRRAMVLLRMAGRLRPAGVRQSFLLLRDVLARGGLTADCVGPEGIGRVRLTLQADGTTFLRCTDPVDAVLGTAASAMAGMATRIETAITTLAATRTLLDLLVFGGTLLTAVASLLSAGRGWAELWRPLLVVVAYAAFVPLRRPLLRLTIRGGLRLALAQGRVR